ncbi:hypothetical protein IE53DRAFT_412540 [Violaceomyces palustris]|uniref:Uncharacterized protein n=1 Tax=Violaceomyces palustris TaxID=1673888 RepID=A0ACD0NQN7_9BASI|nr:hypothetical protein IE53DRAFT_412540 [Violaceomyces palustris]
MQPKSFWTVLVSLLGLFSQILSMPVTPFSLLQEGSGGAAEAYGMTPKLERELRESYEMLRSSLTELEQRKGEVGFLRGVEVQIERVRSNLSKLRLPKRTELRTVKGYRFVAPYVVSAYDRQEKVEVEVRNESFDRAMAEFHRYLDESEERLISVRKEERIVSGGSSRMGEGGVEVENHREGSLWAPSSSSSSATTHTSSPPSSSAPGSQGRQQGSEREGRGGKEKKSDHRFLAFLKKP